MNGNIWMADLDEGIILYEARTRKFSKPFEQTLGARYSTSRLFIRGHEAYSFVADGIIRWNIDNRQVQKISLPAEMNKGLTDMYPDLYGNWWLTSRNGLIAYNEKDNRFNRFTTADGLSQNDINGSLYCSADSTMWIGTPSYFLSFNPSQLMNGSSDSKEILITGILAGNQEIDKPVKGPVTLGYRENNLVIRWALPDYGNPLRNEYYVKLDGIDPAWRYVGNKGEVQYANLSPGNYSIRLRAATANGVDARKNIILDFVIQPPFWKTTWFILVTSFFLITVFILVVRYVSQRNLKEKLLRLEKEQAVEKERNRISRDMHDDLGSGLTKIAILSEVVKKQIHEPEKAREQLENISHSSRELVDNLQDIIWVLNPKNDTLESLAAYIREYGLKFYEPFGTELQFDYPEKFTGVKLSEETRRNIFLVIKETFNNIARHAWCNRVMVSIHQKARGVEISITDDGKGFDIGQVRAFGNGLTNMKNRIEQVGGTFCIESQIGQGTRTILVIPV
jgi:signal transduction histidine kinase